MTRRLAFYAPLKSPRHPVPSGDRRMARALIDVLRKGGHQVELASSFRSFDRHGDAERQARIKTLGGRIAARLLKRYESLPAERRPEAWITYHAYHKSPDWLGPVIRRTLGIPYLLIETSFAPKQAGGTLASRPHGGGKRHQGGGYDFAPDPRRPCRSGPRWSRTRLALGMLFPFLDPMPYADAALDRARYRRAIAERFQMDPSRPWLLTVGMMREDVKLKSYDLLVQSLVRITDRDWQILVVGGGPALPKVEQYLSQLGSERVRMAGILDEGQLVTCYAAADVYAWPAVREAYGLAMLEAQAGGLPVVAGDEGGVSDVVRHTETGLLTPPRDPEAFARALADLLDHPAKCRSMSRAARAFVRNERSLDYAAGQLENALTDACSHFKNKRGRMHGDEVSVERRDGTGVT